MTKKQKKMLARILVCAVMLIALQFLPITGIPRFALYLAAYLVIGFDILKKAAKGIADYSRNAEKHCDCKKYSNRNYYKSLYFSDLAELICISFRNRRLFFVFIFCSRRSAR